MKTAATNNGAEKKVTKPKLTNMKTNSIITVIILAITSIFSSTAKADIVGPFEVGDKISASGIQLVAVTTSSEGKTAYLKTPDGVFPVRASKLEAAEDGDKDHLIPVRSEDIFKTFVDGKIICITFVNDKLFNSDGFYFQVSERKKRPAK